MKAVITKKVKDDKTKNDRPFTTFEAILDPSGKKIKINVFDTKKIEKIEKDTVIEVNQNGQFYNFSDIVGKREVKSEEKTQDPFQSPDDYGKSMDINMCFKKACDRQQNIEMIPDTTKELYEKLLESRKRIIGE